MNFQSLKEEAFEANLALVRHGLVVFTWGNASARDFSQGVMAIKPSGVAYDKLRPADMVIVELESGQAVEPGGLNPSSDTPTHRCLYLAFEKVGGMVHTHSRQATAWAQAGRDLPCFGTTHADYFFGTIPCTAEMTAEEIMGGQGYEYNTGTVIVREFQQRQLAPLDMPAVLVRSHAPFVWGKNAAAAVHTAVLLEELAGMALNTLALSPQIPAISLALLTKHFKRKHGAGAYYGQKHTPATSTSA